MTFCEQQLIGYKTGGMKRMPQYLETFNIGDYIVNVTIRKIHYCEIDCR